VFLRAVETDFAKMLKLADFFLRFIRFRQSSTKVDDRAGEQTRPLLKVAWRHAMQRAC